MSRPCNRCTGISCCFATTQGLAALFLIGLGIAALFLVAPWKVFDVYFGILLLQLIVARHAAATYGVRFVCTVLAQKAGKPTAANAASSRASRG